MDYTQPSGGEEKHYMFWQHCTFGLFSVVGGTWIGTTLLLGDMSFSRLSDICFWETMRYISERKKKSDIQLKIFASNYTEHREKEGFWKKNTASKLKRKCKILFK